MNIVLLSRDYYNSPYCMNEAGIIWYFMDVIPTIITGLPEITSNNMKGFIDNRNLIRRLDNDEDVAHIFDIVSESIEVEIKKESKITVFTKQRKELEKKYRQFLKGARFIVPNIGEGLDDRDRQICLLVSEGPKSTREISELMGLTPKTVHRYLKNLEDRKIIERSGTGKETRFYLSE